MLSCASCATEENTVLQSLSSHGSGVMPLSCLFFACGNIKNASILLGGEERKIKMCGYVDIGNNLHSTISVCLMYLLLFSFP